MMPTRFLMATTQGTPHQTSLALRARRMSDETQNNQPEHGQAVTTDSDHPKTDSDDSHVTGTERPSMHDISSSPPPDPDSPEFAQACEDYRKSIRHHLNRRNKGGGSEGKGGSGDTHPEAPNWINAVTFNPIAPTGPLEYNNREEIWLPQTQRPRRNRKSWAVRRLLQESSIRVSQLVYPLFVHDKTQSEDIESMPGQRLWSVQDLIKEIREATEVGINTFMLFPKIEKEFKDPRGYEACNPYGLIPRAVRVVKAAFPDITICTDVALDPYTSTGHDGVVNAQGDVDNDQTIEQICRQALIHAENGVDVVCPSEMMDGRVGALRDSLDAEGFYNISIMAYSAKYQSSLYSPFRDVVQSSKYYNNRVVVVSKKSYQMDPSNSREADREASLDAEEGADILMVKPATLYLDVIQRIKSAHNIPIAAYHVSGEYSLIKAAAGKGWIDEKKIVVETLKSIRRAGADVIITYFAKDVSRWALEDMMSRIQNEKVDRRQSTETKSPFEQPTKKILGSWTDSINFTDVSF